MTPEAMPNGPRLAPVDIADHLDESAKCMLRSAARLGIACRVVSEATGSDEQRPQIWLQLSMPRGDVYYQNGAVHLPGPDGTVGAHINGDAFAIGVDKNHAKQLLEAADLPVPSGRLFQAQEFPAALRYAAECTTELCIKPNRGTLVRLVFPALRTADEIRQAFLAVAEGYDEILIEESVPGEAWRFFYVEPRVVAMKHSRLPSVVGDGRTSVGDLINRLNFVRSKRGVSRTSIEIGPQVVMSLEREGVDMTSVISAGRRIILNAASNDACGSDSIICLERVHSGYVAQIERACRAVPGLRIAGVDAMLCDPSAPPTPDNHWILEFNSSPGVLGFYFPTEGPVLDVCRSILELLK